MKSLLVAACLCATVGAQDLPVFQRVEAPAGSVWVDSLDLSKAAIRRPRAGRGQTAPPPPLVFSLAGVTYPHAVPLSSDADLTIDLKGKAARFSSMVGIDDAVKAPAGSVIFGVWVDGRKVADSGVMRGGDAPKLIEAALTGAKTLVLAVIDANDGTAGDSADWAGAMITLASGAGPQDQPVVVTRAPEAAPSIAASATASPRINYPRVTGATPGRPFQFKIPASGDAPLTYTARNLPAGLALDSSTGVITGALKGEGRWKVPVSVKNRKSVANAVIEIVGGDHQLAQTPPLGWNSWNVWAAQVDDAKVRAAADGMVSSGLAAQGYTYINIDDAWEGPRDANGEITSNEKFPDMKALADYVHGKGLKIGIYSSPGPATCQQRYAGSYQHEAQDAKTWAKWGFDYIKYDWCTLTNTQPPDGPRGAQTPLPGLKKPYEVMRAALDTLDRDFIFSLCQYGWGSVWEWGASVGGNLWRVTGDITDTWPSMSSIGFQQTGHEKFAGPTHWNDTDMLVVGMVGWGRQGGPRPTNLTPNEQLTHISLWALQAAPLIIGADLSQADRWTVDLLGNREMLAVNQDALGRAAGRVASDGWTQVWSRPLADGSVAVGLFNRGPEAMSVTASFKDLGLSGSQSVLDIWSQKALPRAKDQFTALVPRHGVVFVRLGSSAKP
ncbi:MAG: alpha-galactosidase [Acidobacteria bacterium]|nr:MAG: alpha-galactosidase [Acidobacteriota bacterium]